MSFALYDQTLDAVVKVVQWIPHACALFGHSLIAPPELGERRLITGTGKQAEHMDARMQCNIHMCCLAEFAWAVQLPEWERTGGWN